jgi:hypothetical protein
MTTGGEMLNEIIERLEGVEKQISKLSVELTFREMYGTLLVEHDEALKQLSKYHAELAFLRHDFPLLLDSLAFLLTKHEESINKTYANMADRFPAARDETCLAVRRTIQNLKEKYK